MRRTWSTVGVRAAACCDGFLRVEVQSARVPTCAPMPFAATGSAVCQGRAAGRLLRRQSARWAHISSPAHTRVLGCAGWGGRRGRSPDAARGYAAASVPPPQWSEWSEWSEGSGHPPPCPRSMGPPPRDGAPLPLPPPSRLKMPAGRDPGAPCGRARLIIACRVTTQARYAQQASELEGDGEPA